MKKALALGVLILFMIPAIANAGSIRVYNNDSKVHKVELKCSGSSKSFEIRASTTATSSRIR